MSDRDREKQTLAVQLVILLIGMGLVAFGFAALRGSSRVTVYSYNPTVTAAPEKQSVRQSAKVSVAETIPARTVAPVSRELPASGEPLPTAAPEEPLLPRSVNLNAAGAEELQRLPGIGPVLAERIIEYREDHGGFSGISELTEVEGIGEKTLQKIQEYLTVE